MGLWQFLKTFFGGEPETHEPDEVVPDSVVVDQIRAAGWRQGSLAGPDLIARVGPAQGDVLIVVTHDCDIVSRDLTKEPFVEAVWAKRLSTAPDGQVAHGKNPRRLVFPTGTADAEQCEASIHDRVRFERRLLSSSTPEGAIPSASRDLLSAWIAKRYVRAAFPDAFNDRLSKQMRAIEKALKKDGEEISGVYVLLSSMDELSDAELYTVAVTGTMRVEDYEDAAKRQRAQKALEALRAALSAATGVVVSSASLQSEADFTLDDLRVMLRWDYDALSWKDGGELPPRL